METKYFQWSGWKEGQGRQSFLIFLIRQKQRRQRETEEREGGGRIKRKREERGWEKSQGRKSQKGKRGGDFGFRHNVKISKVTMNFLTGREKGQGAKREEGERGSRKESQRGEVKGRKEGREGTQGKRRGRQEG
jgi:hypothetical protein